ncbi:hypothetical protein NPIL_33971 [Nephila pilipes]|uniref:Uncharacterized protein n=1 Tax=Nephila pilipes TaxID=299642 RepID=A0A8X6P5U1_NEPPI|nr:hypothetical protein NPIL_33971 [Nephila pilipes]
MQTIPFSSAISAWCHPVFHTYLSAMKMAYAIIVCLINYLAPMKSNGGAVARGAWTSQIAGHTPEKKKRGAKPGADVIARARASDAKDMCNGLRAVFTASPYPNPKLF